VTDSVPNPALLPPGGVTETPTTRGTSNTTNAPQAGEPSFASVLATQTAAGTPTFSKHALDRLARRGIEMDGQTLGRLTEGIQRAASKGSTNSVVLVDGTAYVASVKNNTVITAVTPESMRSHVFTNIDSAVIA
jgi:flagellar operon protein